MTERGKREATRLVEILIQDNGYPLIKASCELSDNQLERIIRLFQTILNNRKAKE